MDSGMGNRGGAVLYMTQVEAAEHVAERLSLLQRWRGGDRSAGQQLTMQERAREGVHEKKRRKVQRKEEKKLARIMQGVPSIVESTEQQQQQQQKQ